MGVLLGRARTHECESHSWHTVVSMDAAAISMDGGAVPVRPENETEPERENMRLQVRVSAGTIWRGVIAKIGDADKMRAGKLDSAWVNAVWVGRVVKSNEHLLLTTKGCIRSRVVRRIPDGNQASYHAEVRRLPWDTLKRSAKMLRNATVRPCEPPRPSRGMSRKDGYPA